MPNPHACPPDGLKIRPTLRDNPVAADPRDGSNGTANGIGCIRAGRPGPAGFPSAIHRHFGFLKRASALFFYCLERTRQFWRFFDERTYRTGPFDRDYLLALLEALI